MSVRWMTDEDAETDAKKSRRLGSVVLAAIFETSRRRWIVNVLGGSETHVYRVR